MCAGLLLAGCAGSSSMTPSGSGGSAGTTGAGGASAGHGGSIGGTSGTAGTGGNAGNAGSTAGSSAGAGGGAAGNAGTAGTAGSAGTGGEGGNGGTGGTAGATGGASAGGRGGAGGGAAGATGSGGRGGNGGASAGRGGSAGTASGGAGGATNPCAARAGLRFCDDFESKSVGTLATAAPWVVQLNGSGTLTVDGTTPAHSGSKSIRVHAGDNDYDTLFAFHDTTVLPAPNGRFFLRAYIRLGRAMVGGHNSFIIADPFATPGSGNNLRIGEMNAMLMYTIMGDGHGALSNQNFYTDGRPGVAFAPSTWVCLEVLIDRARPEIDFWVDGTEVPDLHHTDWALDNYDSVRFGFEKYAGPGIDIWYDDIAIGTERIGCQ